MLTASFSPQPLSESWTYLPPPSACTLKLCRDLRRTKQLVGIGEKDKVSMPALLPIYCPDVNVANLHSTAVDVAAMASLWSAAPMRDLLLQLEPETLDETRIAFEARRAVYNVQKLMQL